MTMRHAINPPRCSTSSLRPLRVAIKTKSHETLTLLHIRLLQQWWKWTVQCLLLAMLSKHRHLSVLLLLVQGKKEKVAWQRSSGWASMHYKQRRCGSRHAASGWTQGCSHVTQSKYGMHGTATVKNQSVVVRKQPR